MQTENLHLVLHFTIYNYIKIHVASSLALLFWICIILNYCSETLQNQVLYILIQ